MKASLSIDPQGSITLKVKAATNSSISIRHHFRAHLRPGFRAVYLSASFALPASRSAFTNSSSA
jgi:hypothetical protein